MLKISDFYLDKRKALFSASKWHLDILTFLIKGIDEIYDLLKAHAPNGFMNSQFQIQKVQETKLND